MTLAKTYPSAGPSQGGPAPDTVEVGQWYWVKGKKPWFGCVVHIGSNYVEVEQPRGGSTRIHVDDFWARCTFESNPDAVIDGMIARYQEQVQKLLGRVKEVTASLAIAPSPALQAASETRALSLRGSGQDMG